MRERLRFIEQSLDHQATSARAWTWGWFSFNTMAAGVQAYRASTADNLGDRTDQWVSVGKAVLGMAGRLAQRLSATRGAAELRGLPEGTPEERMRKLQVAERLLRRNAREANQRYSILPHVLNLALNAIGGIIVTAVGKAPGTGWISAGIGVAVGEIVIWTQPTRGKRDLREYEARFEGGDRASSSGGEGASLSLVPMSATPLGSGFTAGMGLELRF